MRAVTMLLGIAFLLVLAQHWGQQALGEKNISFLAWATAVLFVIDVYEVLKGR